MNFRHKKLSAAVMRSAGGDLATRILNYKENQSRKGVQLRGRCVLLIFEDYFKTSEEAGSLYRVEDLLGVYKVTVQDLRRSNKWDATLAGMATSPVMLCFATFCLGKLGQVNF